MGARRFPDPGGIADRGACWSDPWTGDHMRTLASLPDAWDSWLAPGGVVARLLNHRLMAVNLPGSGGVDRLRGWSGMVVLTKGKRER